MINFHLMQLVQDKNDENIFHLYHFEPTNKSSIDKTEEKINQESKQFKAEQKSTHFKAAIKHKLTLDKIKEKILFIFSESYHVKFLNNTCMIKKFKFKTMSLFNFLFLSSVFSLNKQELINLKMLTRTMKPNKLKFIKNNSLKLLNKIN